MSTVIDDLAKIVCFGTDSCDASDEESWQYFRPLAREIAELFIGRQFGDGVTDVYIDGLVQFMRETVDKALGDGDEPVIQ